MSGNRVAAVLNRAAEYVERGWTQRAFARTADGRSVSSDNLDAVEWCASGAVGRAVTDLGWQQDDAFAAARVLRDHLVLPFNTWETSSGRVEEVFGAVARWNDTAPALSPGRVVAKLRAAARRAEELLATARGVLRGGS